MEGSESGELITPCNCRGTAQYIHISCLHLWRISGTRDDAEYRCPDCTYEYQIEPLTWHAKCQSRCILLTCTGLSKCYVITMLSIYYLCLLIASMILHAGLTSETLIKTRKDAYVLGCSLWILFTFFVMNLCERYFRGNWDICKSLCYQRLLSLIVIWTVFIIDPFIGAVFNSFYISVWANKYGYPLANENCHLLGRIIPVSIV